MFYRYTLTVPGPTAETSPVRLDFRLPKGIIDLVMIAFPPGCAAVVYVSIWHHEHQVWPTNPDAWFAWDNYVLEFDESYELEENWNDMSLRAWSESKSTPHTVELWISVTTEKWGIEDLFRLATPISRLEE